MGTEPIGERLGQFIAPHGVALDSRGDIYVPKSPTPIGQSSLARSRITSCDRCKNQSA
jgi:hypothetical protein